MSLELNRRIKSSLSMVVVFAVVMGLGSVIQSEAFKPFLLEVGLSNSLATLVVVFLYQVLAYVLNNLPEKKDTIGSGDKLRSGRALI